jgi:hypothetical protein
MSDVPANIQEFNQIVGLSFAQLYKSHPAGQDIDREGIAKAMGVGEANWSQHQLPSGHTLGQMVTCTIGWLNMEQYIQSFGYPAARVLLTTKGLAAMQAVPSGLKESLGAQLTKVVEQKSTGGVDLSRIGEMVGGFFAGFTKSMGSG